MVTPTRPPNNRTLSTRSTTEPVELPLNNSSTVSTPSIADDNDPLRDSIEASEKDDMCDNEDDERRGRSSTIDPMKYEMDPRNMSPRRDSEELDQLGAEAKARLEAQAQTLQSGLRALLDRVEKVREEHDRLEGENRFLQEYIGSLVATSNRPASGARGRNSGGRINR
ncbi:hypothetical protein FPQ18DRAFT_105215 [Pyronema domesticum]|uniref:Similar to Short coiled-coil protein homolog acc. no. A8NJZ7 n=1 Tax=Pyronema omphalodes (strain CBS 100304) TaxID=1076935 RepID=U4LUX4_PYROM|nr:hypothetical protein FPQ18DRAFT_105215 [Pyronema domesticum]CCX32026.1 Similar to Short coiled-coil protein homolog; acc. no. A8NJZ7 [Pyronema omphalodes CBS 100304]